MIQIDWNAVADRAKGMSAASLHYAILDCNKAAIAADKLEREGYLTSTSKSGGYYRDEASIYHNERKARQ